MTTDHKEQGLTAMLAAVREHPDDFPAWEELEAFAASMQTPEVVAECYAEALSRDLPRATLKRLGERATRFCEEWFADEAPHMQAVLLRVFENDASDEAIFDRLCMGLTATGGWERLLDLYEKAVDATDSLERRIQLLEDAVRIAKDAADDTERAIAFMTRLVRLKPQDAALRASLERLLTQGERFRELIALWDSAVEGASPAEAADTKVRIAACWLDKLGNAPAAMDVLTAVLEASPEHTEALALTERILGSEDAAKGTRRSALALLRATYEGSERPLEAARVMRLGRGLFEGEERAQLHRDAARLWLDNGAADEALTELGELLQLKPDDEALTEEIAKLAQQQGQIARQVEILARAAEQASSPRRAAQLRLSAATLAHDPVGQVERAIELCERVFRDDRVPDLALDAGRALDALLEAQNQRERRLDVLARLAELEGDKERRLEVWGALAKLAHAVDQPQRAIETWRKRLAESEHDREALNGLSMLYESTGEYRALVQVLEQRLALVEGAERGPDLGRIAQVYAEHLDDLEAALRAWRELYEVAPELVEGLGVRALLEKSAERTSARNAQLSAALGDGYRTLVNDVERALACYTQALRTDPSLEAARAGLAELLSVDAVRARAAEVLAEAYTARGDREGLVALLPHRLFGAAEAHARARLLREAAQLEVQLGRPERALEHRCAALVEQPEVEAYDGELFELANQVAGFAPLAEALLQAAAKLDPTLTRAVFLRTRAAEILELKLSQPEQALEAYASALAAAPAQATLSSAVCRLSAAQGQLARAVEVVLAAAQREGRVPETLLELLERETTSGADGFRELAGALDAQLGSRELEADVKRALLVRAASWLETRCEDAAGAEALLSKACAVGAPHEPTLRKLAALQRTTPSASLFSTLMTLAELEFESLDSLIEAEQVAKEVLQDAARERQVLEGLVRRCTALWLRGLKQAGPHAVDAVLLSSTRRLSAMLADSGEFKAQVALLQGVALLPLDADAAKDLAAEAAQVAAERLNDPELAISLYQNALERAPRATDVMAALATQYDRLGRLDELLVLRRRELALAEDVSRRLTLRLDLARVMAEIEARGGRIGALRDNLREAPGHEESLRALEALLRERGALGEVYDLFAAQAGQLEASGEAARAAELWLHAARLADAELKREDQALHAYQKAVAVGVTREALEALARIRMERDEPAQAVPWFERLLEHTEGEERVSVRLRLSRAYQLSDKTLKAERCLVDGIAEAPQSFELRDMLAEHYRAHAQPEPLAVLLAENAMRMADRDKVLAYAREAAELFCGPLAQPERAVEVLSKAVQIDGEDRALKCLYADALIAARRLDEARGLLEEMLAAFGRRRSPERAEVHVRLSRVAQASGNMEEALEQLDTASSMDRAHVGILRALGELAQQAGQLDRAERAFRALLMAAKKPQAASGPEIGVAEVLYQLHDIVRAQGHADKAAELLEQAVETAVQSEVETARLRVLLTSRGERALLKRVLELRLAQVDDPATEAKVRSDLADLLEIDPATRGDAFEERLRAVGCVPTDAALHQQALRLGQALDRVPRYVETLRSLCERARRKEDVALSSHLALRAGTTLEQVLGDPKAAAAQYELVDASSPDYMEAQFALARVSGKLGRGDEERQFLERILALPDEPAHAASKLSARYRLVEIKVAAPETREEGMTALLSLLEEAPDYARAGAILQTVCDQDPNDERALRMLEQLARKSDDPFVLLDFLERHAHGPQPSLGLIREGAELAVRMKEHARAERLFLRAIDVAERGDGVADALWAVVGLGRLRNQMGDVQGALDWLERAMLASDPIEAFELGLELAQMAEERAQDPARAARIYETLRERDPGDRRVWMALLSLYKRSGDLDRMLALVRATLEALVDPSERNALRLDTARLLFDAGREDDGAALLHEVLAEDPDNEEAALRLADLYERRGENEAMAELLGRKLESARERRSPSLIPLAVRMGGLLSPTRPEQALEIYREGLALVPDSPELIRAALAVLDPERDAAERADLVERYLRGDGYKDEGALELALWLLDYQTQNGDESAFERALALAYRVAPGHAELRARLEQWYRQREDYPSLAQMLEQQAGHEQDKQRCVALLLEAADIRLHRLGQPSEAAALVRKARQFAPSDLELLKRAVLTSAASGDLGAALAEIDQALEGKRKKRERVELLLLRAEVAGVAGMHDEALAALEAAYADGGAQVLEQLVVGLDRARLAASERDDGARERELTMRLVSLLHEAKETARAIDLLIGWVQRAQRDVEALRVLLELLSGEERWEEVINVAEALMVRDEPEALGAIAERLMGAARALGRVSLARDGLERGLARDPEQKRIVQLLAELYQEIDEKRALAHLIMRYLPQSKPEKHFEQLRRAGQLLLDSGDVDGALVALTQAFELKPDDLPTVLFIADAHIAAKRFQEAQDLLERAMNSYRQRRSPELAQLRYRMARLSAAAGDPQARLEWLNSALDADMNNGEVASELAVVAQNMGDLDTALKALRAVTMLKTEAPMSRAEAFYRQAVIVAQKGEPRRAVLWAKKAKAENASFPGVDQLLAELGEG